MNGDLLLEMNFQTFMDKVEVASNSTICSVQVEDPSRYGVLHLEENKIVDFIEKPDDLKYGNNISMGFYYLMKQDIQSIIGSLSIPSSFEKDVFPQLSKNLLLDCFKVNGKMIDVGTRESYIEAHTSDESNWIGENVSIGENTNIKNSVIFENCNIGSNVQINNSIILKNTFINEGSEIHDEIY
tara:strand:+ start:10 stop:561 length:552 start_codon:yes stop_codon:yes gene_type:complete